MGRGEKKVLAAVVTVRGRNSNRPFGKRRRTITSRLRGREHGLMYYHKPSAHIPRRRIYVYYYSYTILPCPIVMAIPRLLFIVRRASNFTEQNAMLLLYYLNMAFRHPQNYIIILFYAVMFMSNCRNEKRTF